MHSNQAFPWEGGRVNINAIAGSPGVTRPPTGISSGNSLLAKTQKTISPGAIPPGDSSSQTDLTNETHYETR